MFVIAFGLVLSADTSVAAMSIDLTKDWRFAPDPDLIGEEQGWMQAAFDDSTWTLIDAGKRWEDQGFPEVDGAGWYRKRILAPAEMRAPYIWLNLGGINDSGVIYCNGVKVAAFGDEENKSITNQPVAANLTAHIRWGQENLIVVRAYDQGVSGGLTQRICTLTTNLDELPLTWRLRFIPGFDGQPSIVGLEMAPQPLPPTARLHVQLSLNEGPLRVKEAPAITDYMDRSIGAATFDIDAKPGDQVHIRAEILGAPEAGKAGFQFERTYTWPAPPQWPGEYSDLRVLNNFVTELKAVDRIAQAASQMEFQNPRDGWVFISILNAKGATAHLDNASDPLIWRAHPVTGALEAMQYLAKGKHQLKLTDAQGARLDIRAVPETVFCYWPSSPSVNGFPERDRAFGERHVFPNMNTLVRSGDMSDADFESWRAEGRRWLAASSVLGLSDANPPTAEAMHEKWAGSATMTQPGYSGMIVDEFLGKSAGHFAAWTEGLNRLAAMPNFEDKTFYAWVQSIHSHPPGLAFMQRLHELGGRFGWMRYCHEEPTWELAMLHIYEMLDDVEEWEALMPGVKERITVFLGSFVMPTVSLNNNPGVNYIPYMDAQFRVLATDPMLNGIGGMAQWSSNLADDDTLRYAQDLFRHYCIEGKRTPYGAYPYRLTHIENPDFDEGLVGWRVEPAEPDGIVAAAYKGFAMIGGRWQTYNGGDRCAILTASNKGPNRIGQSITGLKPGHLYSVKYVAANLDRFAQKEESPLSIELEGAQQLPERSVRNVLPSPIPVVQDGAEEAHTVYTTYSQIVFRAEGETVELTFSDWRDASPAAEAGQRIAFNFVEVQPYYE